MVATLEKTLSTTEVKDFDKSLDLFFFDANLEGRDNLIPYISKDTKIVPVESSENFFTKLLEYSSQKINNLYVLCHGTKGELKIGSKVVNTETLSKFSDSNSIYIEKISLLSCNVGQDIEFIENLSETFNCVVNYSDKLVGHKSLGGTWELNSFSNDSGSNNIISFNANSLPFPSEVVKNWKHTMGIIISASSIPTLVSNPTSLPGYSPTGTVQITGELNIAQANLLAGVAASTMTATVAPGLAADLAGITVRSGRTNAFTLTTTDTTASASALSAVKAISSLAPNFGSVTGITASLAADVISLYSPLNGAVSANTSLGNETISVSDVTVAAADLVAIDGYTTGNVTTTALTMTGGATDALAVLDSAQVIGTAVDTTGTIKVTITEASVNATTLNDINDSTTGRVTVQSTTVTGTYTEVNNALIANAAEPTANVGGVATPTGNTISGMDAIAVTLTAADGTAASYTPQEIRTVAGRTTGIVTATSSSGDAAANVHATTGLAETGHAITVILTDTTPLASELKTLDTLTTVPITFDAANTGYSITGNSADVLTVLSASGINIRADVPVTITGAVTVDALNQINALTTGIVTTNAYQTGLAMQDFAALTDNVDSSGNHVLSGGNPVENVYKLTPSDTTVSAAALQALNAKTSANINLTNVTTITGSLTELATFFTSGGVAAGFINHTNKAVTVTDTGVLDADLLQQVNALTTSLVTVSGTVTGLTGSAANVATLFADKGTAGNKVAFTANPDVTITDTTTTAAANLVAIEAATTGLVTVTGATTISGSEADVNTILTKGTDVVNAQGVVTTAKTIVGVTDNPVTVTGETVALADLSTLTTRTTGVVTASVVETNITTVLAAAAAEIKPGSTINNLTFTVSTNTGGVANTVDAADLISLSALTTGPIKATSSVATGITGTVADLKTVYAANTALGGGGAITATSGFTGLEAEPITIATTDTRINADDLIYLTGKNGANLVTHAATHLTGLQADIAAVYAGDEAGSPTIAGTGLTTILTVTDSSVAAAGLQALNAKSNAVVTFTGSEISGTFAELQLALLNNIGKKLNGAGARIDAAATELLTGLDSVNLSFTAATPVEILELETLTTGTLTGAVTGATAASLIGTDKIDDLTRVHNLAITSTDTTFSAANIVTLNSKTSGLITLNAATTITGNASQVLAAYALPTTSVTGLGNEALIISGGISVADFNTIAGKTTGLITANITTTDATTLKTIAESGHNLTITIADTSVAATDISAIDALTAGDVTINSATITGSYTEIAAVNTLRTAGTTVLSANDKAYTLTSPVTVTEANAIHAYGSGTVTATISNTLEDDLEHLTGTPATGGANAYTITLSEATYTGADLNAINDRTSLVLDASSVTLLTGDADDVLTALVENSNFAADRTTASPRTITGLDNVAVTIAPGTDTATLSEIVDIENLTTGLVTATVTAGGTTGEGLDHLIAGATAAQPGIGLVRPTNAISVTVVDNAGTAILPAADLLTLNSRTTGLISVAAGKQIQGSVDDIKAAFAANVAPAVAGTQITGLQVTEVNITYAAGVTSVAAADLNYLNTQTNQDVNAAPAVAGTVALTGIGTTDTGLPAGDSVLKTVLDDIAGAGQIVWAGDIPVTITDTITSAEAAMYAGKTSGAVTATLSNGAMAELDNATLGTETGHAWTITITDSSVDMGDLHTLNGKTTVSIDATAVTTFTGDITEMSNVYGATGADNVITGIGNENVVLSGTPSVTNINDRDQFTTGSIKATVATGSLAALSAIQESGNELALNVDDATIDPAALNALIAKTTGVVTLSGNGGAPAITGFASDIAKIYATGTQVTGLGNETVTISDTGTILASELNTINGGTSVAVVATNVTGLSGSADDVKTTYTSGGITGLGNETVTITGATSAASTISDIDGTTSGLVTVNSTAITGSLTEVTALYAANNATTPTIAGLGNEAITITGASLTVAEANAVDLLTTGAVTATISANDVDSLATLTGTGNAYTLTVTDTNISAANINSLNAKTTGTINVLSTSVTGAATDLITAFAAQGSGVTGLGSETVTVTSGKKPVATAGDLKLVGGFDANSYLASNADVLAALGSNATTAHAHYIDYGYAESRSTDTFNELNYVASYSDLITAIGDSTTVATQHYVNHGYSEGRTTTFDELAYVASYSDLITNVGSTEFAGAAHYINHGSTEGRTTTFNASSYLAAHADLRTVFGTNESLAAKHYIDYGYSEGRALA